MATGYILWNEHERDTYRVGGKTVVFGASADASTHLAASSQFRADVLPKPWTTARVWDVVTVTVA